MKKKMISDSLEEAVEQFNLKNKSIIDRLNYIKVALGAKKHINISYQDLIRSLETIIDNEDIDFYLYNMLEVTIEDKLEIYFTLKKDEDILRLYDIEQNYDQSGLGYVKQLKK